MFGFIGVSDVLLLIALGTGYMVFYLAKREDKGLRLIGFVIGTVIVASAISYMLINIIAQNQLCEAKTQYYKRMMLQPHMMPRLPALKR
jgi:hypothetical protein